MKTLIVTGGNVNKDFLLEIMNKEVFDTIIAVDNGLSILNENRIKPNHIVGDFDTIDTNILAEYRNDKSIEIHEYNPVKDNTDTDIAIKLAIELKSNKIIILGAIGARLDHVLGNIHVLKYAMDNDTECKILDENNEIKLINKTTILNKKEFLI